MEAYNEDSNMTTENSVTETSEDLNEDTEEESNQSLIEPRQLRHRRHREENLEHKKRRIDKLISLHGESTSNDSREGSCEQSVCSLDTQCCVQLSPNCSNVNPTEDKVSVTHFHLTNNEHLCYHCYEEIARAGRKCNQKYIEWKNMWLTESRCSPSLRLFTMDCLLPYWLQCCKCGKFRKVKDDVTDWEAEKIAEFDCSKVETLQNERDPCKAKESEKVKAARELEWIQSASAASFLHNSPALQYLREEYYCDEVGMSPSRVKDAKIPKPQAKFMFPFNIPNAGSVAFCVRPDGMEYDELERFPEFSIECIPYLALRNLVVSLWALNPFELLTYEKCLSHLVCRGLSRVWYSVQLKQIYNYLCIKNMINYGVLSFPDHNIISEYVTKQLKVIVVGAGISGLATARQLTRHGADVTVLEATERIGGRMYDDFSLGVAVGCGAQLITGLTNSPIVLLCEQTGSGYKSLSDECPLVDAGSGKTVNSAADRIVDEHFNCILDAIGEWRKVTSKGDTSLADQVDNFHQKFLSALPFEWTPEYDRLLQWQIGNVEFSCGASLSKVSARNWDQNEAVGQFAGDHALLKNGSKKFIHELATGLDVQLNYKVKKVDYNKNKVTVTCENEEEFKADKVVFCLPLAVYQQNSIKFQPALPQKKVGCLKKLGAGLIEKVAVRFPTRFWKCLLKKDGTLDYFGNVPKGKKFRGLFNMFYDFSSKVKNEEYYVLMSYVCGESVDIVNKHTEEEVVDIFVDALKALFPNIDIPKPLGHVVTHWGQDSNIGMSYSYVKVNGNGEDYDGMADPVDRKIYFAGECTNRFFPQTMTGAYVSGLREASRVVEHWISDNTRSR
ncbi:unnamed protein product [Bursaphelenchus okinawaensis]|uniref:SWIRM domain-containing protein n=1 Tax=Bursaphelenchus okinawaensis TaxID=465554 RepID=A0A811LKU5_9BILA|nr:unnamed protein product [Bursaphelenchus okinawaensis]CAG9125806.1 unnamed protein product [Bursaphelenchus okinawaensis]